MPQPRKHSASSSSAAAAPEPAAAATAPTSVSLARSGTPLAPKDNHEHDHAVKHAADTQPPVGYESPLKKMKKSMLQHKRKLIVTIDELRQFITANDASLEEACGGVRIQARLLWYAPVTLGGTKVLRLYLGEQQAPEPLEQQQREYQEAQREDEFGANEFLITLSLYGIAPDNPSLPAPGSVIAFNPTKLKIYRECCQVRSTLQAITTVVEAP